MPCKNGYINLDIFSLILNQCFESILGTFFIAFHISLVNRLCCHQIILFLVGKSAQISIVNIRFCSICKAMPWGKFFRIKIKFSRFLLTVLGLIADTFLLHSVILNSSLSVFFHIWEQAKTIALLRRHPATNYGRNI